MNTLQPEQEHLRDFSFDAHIFKEGDAFVAHAPALDVSSCGATDEEARRNIRDAVRGFLAASADLGTLDEILREAGYRLSDTRGTDTRTSPARPELTL